MNMCAICKQHAPTGVRAGVGNDGVREGVEAGVGAEVGAGVRVDVGSGVGEGVGLCTSNE